MTTTADADASPEEEARVAPRTKVWRAAWMLAAAAIALIVIVSIARPTHPGQVGSPPHSFAASEDLVGVVGPRQIFIRRDTPLSAHLGMITVQKTVVSYPLLTVTGAVTARIRPGTEPLETRWQFASAAIATDYAEWLKTAADVEFNEKQLATTRELTKAQIDRYDTVVTHLRPAAKDGGVSLKELRNAEADLVQAKLQGQKDVFAAESALRVAIRQRNALERQLAQEGVEPSVLSRAREGMLLISANVPEAKMSLVEIGQPCQARFYAFPKKVFAAHVEELGSVLSTERRTLRVLFDLDDPDNQLKPGMFAEVGLGTSDREVILISANAVLHIGQTDYVFKRAGDSEHFEVTPVEISESRGDDVEVLKGLAPGDQIAGTQAVLLKPLAVQSLER